MGQAALKYGIGGVALMAGVLAFSPAHAVLNACPASFTTDPTAKVEDATGTTTAASACQYVTPPDNNNVASIANINAEGFFGETDWESNGQDQINANSLTGSWSIANPDFDNYDYAIFFKDGSGTNLVGFQFNEDFTNGVWSSPFTNPPFVDLNTGQTKEVSHYTIARNPEDPTPVPEPATLVLLGSALLGLGVLHRRRRTDLSMRR